MSTIAYYFLQVVLCSGLMMGYYLLVLRNKKFHQYNRFYLLAAALMSWIVPLIKIRWTAPVVAEDADVYQLLYIVANNNSKIEKTVNTGFEWSGYTVGAILYVLVTVVFLTAMIMALYKVYRLLKFHSYRHVDDVYLILTREQGTPFSFFRYIFWNEEIDIRSESGKQILEHEIAHVKQKHSIDKVLIQVMLIPGWFNPFFWLLKKELEMIHEFIADKKAVNNGDSASLAQMLLTAAFPQQNFALTNPFFFSPIRRRLQMLTDNSSPRFSYLRRVIVLPLLAIVVMLFSFRAKEETLSLSTVVEKVISAVDIPLRLNKQADAETMEKQPETHQSRAAITKKNDTTFPVKIAVKYLDLDTPKLFYRNRAANESLPVVIKTSDSATGYYTVTGVSLRAADTTIPVARHRAIPLSPLIIIDGEKMPKGYSLDSLNINSIDKISILKNGSAITKYGAEAADGVIEIETRPPGKEKLSEVSVVKSANIPRDPNKPVTVVGYAIQSATPGFPGGNAAWNQYLDRNQDKDVMKNNGAPAGRYAVTVAFTVSESGSVSDIHVENDPGYGAKNEIVRLIKKGPKWLPYEKDGKKVKGVAHRTIFFTVE